MRRKQPYTDSHISRRRVSRLLTGATVAVLAIVVGLLIEDSHFNDGLVDRASTASVGP